MRPRPVLLSGDVYTSSARTPWGGTRLVERFGKRSGFARIGESWELSLGPELPSRTRDGLALSALVEGDRDEWLGPSRERSAGLLVKLLDADEPLSLQIHPRDDHPGLGRDESGKPEAWYVVHAEPGAWIAFGWSEGVQREDVLAALRRADGSLASQLQRVPVEIGDCFVVDAGTPHAIGPGVTLVEPQYVTHGRRGVTYRYWDWERRYDTQGRPDPAGTARALHVDEAVAVTDWEAVGTALLERSYKRFGAPRRDGELSFELLAGQASSPNTPAIDALASDWLRIVRIAGTGTKPFFHGESLHALTVLEGTATFLDHHRAHVLELGPGDTAAIPARHDDLWLEGRGLHAIRASIEP
ncbi:MAG: class I mannose-6-phosphate isomerase [Sandaracinaceae bacterium]|nr:class I mannose-6-phosphate isomerase [Sandaracinaceae bacterium]